MASMEVDASLANIRMVNREELKTVLKLSPEKNVVFAQTVGYPAE
jgi:hypothetical protein